MPLDVKEEITIGRPKADVSNYAFEPTNDPVWISGITEAHLLTERPIGRGTRVQRLARFLGRTIDYVLEVETFEPERLMVMRSVKSPFPMRVTYRFDELSEGETLAQIRVEGSAQGYYRLADVLMAPQVKRSLRRDLRQLKRIMEDGE